MTATVTLSVPLTKLTSVKLSRSIGRKWKDSFWIGSRSMLTKPVDPS
jgi:hypothetical protein